MYTVFRIVADVENVIFKNAVEEFDQCHKGFDRNFKNISAACSICKSEDWSKHIEDMVCFMKKSTGLLKKYTSQDMEFVFDVAIGSEDFNKYIVRSFTVDLVTMNMFCDNKVAIEFSVYGSIFPDEDIQDDGGR